MALIEGLLLCLFLFAEIFASAHLKVGDPCGPKKDRTCLVATDCPEAMAAKIRMKMHGLERCGWQLFDEIVCCTRPKVDDRFPLRKSTKECMEYWKGTKDKTVPLIYNGFNATLGSFPHMAALGFDKHGDGTISWGDCAGSLISKNFVLTAAHCIVTLGGRKPVVVRLGKVDLFGNEDNVEPQDIRIIEDIVHDQYNHFQKLHDIALLRLEKDVEINQYVKPICLQVEKEEPMDTGLIIAGWGKRNRTGTTSRFLLQAFVESVNLNSCNQTYLLQFQRTLFDTYLCALSPEDFPSDTCEGDSGGPLQIVNRRNNQQSSFILVGVTAFGQSCGNRFPSVYTRVANYLDWIEATVWP